MFPVLVAVVAAMLAHLRRVAVVLVLPRRVLPPVPPMVIPVFCHSLPYRNSLSFFKTLLPDNQTCRPMLSP